MRRFFAGLFLVLAIATTGLIAAHAQPAVQPTVDITKVPAAAQPSDHFDADAATQAYLDMMPPAAIARSNAYFEGGYWLILWDFLVSSAIALLLLELRWSARMRNRAEKITRYKPAQTFLYWAQYLVIATILGFPMEYYENYVREHQYGMRELQVAHPCLQARVTERALQIKRQRAGGARVDVRGVKALAQKAREQVPLLVRGLAAHQRARALARAGQAGGGLSQRALRVQRVVQRL